MLYNPFVKLFPELVRKKIERGEVYFVRQHTARGHDPLQPGIRKVFIFSTYTDKLSAQKHMLAIRHDRYRKLYDANDPQDLESLFIAAGHTTPYLCYADVFETNYERQLSREARKKILSYATSVLNWQIRRPADLSCTFFIQYGELFAKLKYKSGLVKIRFEDIEKLP